MYFIGITSRGTRYEVFVDLVRFLDRRKRTAYVLRCDLLRATRSFLNNHSETGNQNQHKQMPIRMTVTATSNIYR